MTGLYQSALMGHHQGGLIFFSGPGEFDCHPGDLLCFPPGSRHAAAGIGAEGAVYYELLAPGHPDQLSHWVGNSILRFD